MSRPTVYSHFADRQLLVAALVGRAVDQAVRAFEEARVDEGDPVEGLRRLIVTGWEHLARHLEVSSEYAAPTSSFKFQVNYPGVELHVTDDKWEILVHSRCRHYTDGRCALFDQPERPIRCTYYDSWTCDLRAVFDDDWPTATDRGRRVDATGVGSFLDRIAVDLLSGSP